MVRLHEAALLITEHHHGCIQGAAHGLGTAPPTAPVPGWHSECLPLTATAAAAAAPPAPEEEACRGMRFLQLPALPLRKGLPHCNGYGGVPVLGVDGARVPPPTTIGALKMTPMADRLPLS